MKFPKLLIALISLGLLTYISSLRNGFVWDDFYFITQNILVADLGKFPDIFLSNTVAGAGLPSNYYRPVTTLTFALDHAFFGFNPFFYHLINTILHLATGVILFAFLTKIGLRKILSFWLALFFLVHPIQTEAVTYLSSRGDILYTLFLLASLYLFYLSLSGNRLLLIPALILYPLSILAKEAALTTFPLYLILLILYKNQQKISLNKFIRNYRPYFSFILFLFFITLIYFLLRLTILNFGNTLNYGGGSNIYTQSLLIRIFTFLKTLVIYIRILAFPYPLYLERDTPIVTSLFSPWVLGSLALIILVSVFALIEYKKKKTLWIFFGMMIVAFNLLSTSGIIPQTAIIRENWLYFPIVGVTLIFFESLKLLFPNLSAHSARFKLSILGIMVILILMAATIRQNANWSNNITYLEHNLKFTKTARLYLNLGSAYMAQGNLKKAERILLQAVKTSDAYPDTHINLGFIYRSQKKIELAEKAYLRALTLNPNYLYSYPPLIAIYLDKKEYEKARPLIKRLTAIYPKDAKFGLLYAEVLLRLGENDQAEKEFNRIISYSKNKESLLKTIAKIRLKIESSN